MKIIGFNLIKISAERKEKVEGELKINQNIDIKDIQKESLPFTSEDSIKIKFNFKIDYSEESASLEFEGYITILPDKGELKQFLDSWKNKQLPENFRTPLFNFIMSKCNIKALNLEDEINIPYHVPMPRLNPQQQPVNQTDN